VSQGWRSKPLPKGWEKTRRRILKRDEGRCYVCGRDGCRKVDHIIPVCRGGEEDDSNLAAICDACEGHKTALEANAAKPKRERPRTDRHPGLI
jgi:5-methylcytosine-specific restriction endonuclease McrA